MKEKSSKAHRLSAIFWMIANNYVPLLKWSTSNSNWWESEMCQMIWQNIRYLWTWWLLLTCYIKWHDVVWLTLHNIKQHVRNWKMQCFQGQGTEEKCIFDGCLLKKNLAVCEMSLWPFAVLEDGEWILCLDISLGSDQLKDAVENIVKDGKLLGKQLDPCKVCFLNREGEWSEISLMNQRLTEKHHSISYYPWLGFSLGFRVFCWNLKITLQAVRFKHHYLLLSLRSDLPAMNPTVPRARGPWVSVWATERWMCWLGSEEHLPFRSKGSPVNRGWWRWFTNLPKCPEKCSMVSVKGLKIFHGFILLVVRLKKRDK